MLYLNQTYEFLTGGYYSGNTQWNKKHSEIDNCFKLYQLTQGEVFIRDEKQTFCLQADQLYFINGNKLDRQYCHSSFSTHWLHFIPKDLIVYRALLSLPAVVQLSEKKDDLQDILTEIDKTTSMNLTELEKSFIKLRIQTLLQTTTLELLSFYPIDQSSISMDTLRIEPAIQYLNTHYKEPIKLDLLAAQCALSANYFHKLFRSTLNLTPANYQNLLRMNAALQLLDNNRQTVKSIAYELGFTDEAHFCRSFKKHYEITPGEYRKKKRDILF